MEVFTEQDKRDLIQALKDAEALRGELARAKRAGIDVTQLEEELQRTVLQLKQLESVYVKGKKT